MKILLLTDIPPCRNYTAGLVLDQLCRFLPRGSLACFAPVNPYVNARLTPDLEWIPIAYTHKRNEQGFRQLRRPWTSAGAAAVETLRRTRVVPRLIAQAEAFARDQQVDRIWAVLQGQTVIQMAPELADRLQVPLYTHVWDPLSWWLFAHQIDRYNSARAREDFDRALRRSRGCATASWAMADEYQRKFGTHCVPVIASHSPEIALRPDLQNGVRDKLSIGMAGQFYAGQEWAQLVHALNTAGWQVSGKSVTITVVGPTEPPPTAPPGRVRYLGWQSQPDAMRILSECDILYCPYPFAPELAEVSRLSFPSKLVLYFCAGRPVLFHGPEDSSPSRFLADRDAGICVNEYNAAAVYNGLSTLVDSCARYVEVGDNGRRAFMENFTLDVMRNRFFECLGVSDEALAEAQLASTRAPAAVTPQFLADVRPISPLLARMRTPRQTRPHKAASAPRPPRRLHPPKVGNVKSVVKSVALFVPQVRRVLEHKAILHQTLTLTTAERDALKGETALLRQERDEMIRRCDTLQTDLRALEGERDRIQSEGRLQLSESGSLRRVLDSARDEARSLREERDVVTRELDSFRTERSALGDAFDKVRHEAEAVRREYDALVPRLEVLAREREAQREELERAKHDREAQREELERAKHDREALRQEFERTKHDRDAQRQELERTKHDRDAQRQELERAKHDRDAQRQELERTKHDRDSLRSEHDSVRQRLETLSAERDATHSEIQTLRRERDALGAERDSVRVDLGIVRAEHESTRSERDVARNEGAGARHERDMLRVELDSVRRSYDTLRAELDLLRAERDSVKSERDMLRSEHESTRRSFESTRLDYEAVRTERDSARVELGIIRSERESLRTERDLARTDVEAARRELDVTRAERDSVRSHSEASLAESAAARSERDIMKSERDQLIGQLDLSKAEHGTVLAKILARTTQLEERVATNAAPLAVVSKSGRGAAAASPIVEMYLDLLEGSLTGTLSGDPSMSPWSPGAYDPEVRQIGRDWPKTAATMIGVARMRSIRHVLKTALREKVPGDLIETGAWRGGACIYMRGILKAYGVTDRRVWVADSFRGLPKPDPKSFPADSGDEHHAVKELAVSLEEVQANFAKYGLLDDQVSFLPGWFKDTLPKAAIKKLALLRLDGDMYESTIQALDALYRKVSRGGFVVVDDYILPACRKAIDDYRTKHRIRARLEEIDGAAVYWRVP